jgi:dTDP-4-dehydrorhamnose 3,5-epimerase
VGLSDFGRRKRAHAGREKSGTAHHPANVYHCWKNIGTSEAIIINMPTRMYNYEAPDALDLPWDSEAAARTIPYRW